MAQARSVRMGLTAATMLAKAVADFDDVVFADMHDGDQKAISLHDGSLTIKPSHNNQTWTVESPFDYDTDSATVDFKVPGKPSPPPVNLKATYWKYETFLATKSVFEFTDPSGTLAKADFPLNQWVELPKEDEEAAAKLTCPELDSVVFADMHDGDKKAVSMMGSKMTIKPSGNDQTWTVEADVDLKKCQASVDFNVPGKPGPPPVPVTLTWGKLSDDKSKTSKSVFEFTDPSGKLAAPGFPLNHWVSLGGEMKFMV
eukprot:TRINITY_DN74138_c0_g1_i1.p1 TRINITY_DN74138_c0_g1~~TRINITY_DN74138_c0_g1_i1.p1  ORF type:complete len:285 (+),score=66.38 TRINITY_DN74138_c0_g1_i1:86-856(+)